MIIFNNFRNEKQLAINLFEQHLGEGLQRSKALKEASKHLSIPAIRIQDFCKEKEQTGILVDNDRKRYRSKNMFEKLDDLQRNIIRRTVLIGRTIASLLSYNYIAL